MLASQNQYAVAPPRPAARRFFAHGSVRSVTNDWTARCNVIRARGPCLLIAARSLAKLGGVLLLARPAGISWRQGLLLGLALSPAAGPVMVAAADLGQIYPDLQGTLMPVAMSAAAIMELAGPVIVALCLKWSGERRE